MRTVSLNEVFELELDIYRSKSSNKECHKHDKLIQEIKDLTRYQNRVNGVIREDKFEVILRQSLVLFDNHTQLKWAMKQAA